VETNKNQEIQMIDKDYISNIVEEKEFLRKIIS
jgi:hypothetical protein